jgi:hypothetical protein
VTSNSRNRYVLVAIIGGALLVFVLSPSDLSRWAHLAEIAQGIAAVVLLFYALLFAGELRESIRARHLDGLRYVWGVIGTREASDERRWVYQTFGEAKAEPSQLSLEELDRVREICKAFDHIGLLCRHGLVPAEVVVSHYTGLVLDMWQLLEPTVVYLRTKYGHEYFREFEWLAQQAKGARKARTKTEPNSPGTTSDASPVATTLPEANDHVQEFVNDDEGYFTWLRAHSDGLVLNIGVHPHSLPGRYNQVLHRATCRHINNSRTNTGPTWKKVCSLSREELIRYGERQEGEVPTFCSTCQP